MTIPPRLLEVQKIIVKIDDVDIPNRVAHARDKSNVLIQVSFRDQPGGILHIPTQGQRWVVSRTGHGPWYLMTKLDSHDEHQFAIDSMSPGDTRLAADGAMHMQLDSAYMNGQGLGYTVKDNFYSSTGWTTATLSSPPASVESIHVLLNGILVAPELYSVNGRVITFHNTMALGGLVITYQVWQRSLVDAGTVVGRAVITGVDLFT